MPAGFIYVLINPAMPGLAKIGKTTRNPTSRMAELSNATGVPTPFVLAFQQAVKECDQIEAQIHKDLEKEGYRVSTNREFFNAPLHVIVQKILHFSNSFQTNESESIQVPSKNLTITENDTLADELYELGISYQNGTDFILKNPRKAIKLFEQAAEAGSLQAAARAASMYRLGAQGIQKNAEKALTLYLKALNLGGWYYEPNIAEIFLENTQKQSIISHWKNFFEKSVFETDRYMNDETPLSLDIGRGVFKYFESVIKGKIPHVILDETVLRLKNHSIRFANENFSFYAKFKYHLLDEKLFIDFMDIFTKKRELSINELVEIRRKK